MRWLEQEKVGNYLILIKYIQKNYIFNLNKERILQNNKYYSKT